MSFGSVATPAQSKKLLNLSGTNTSTNQEATPVPYFAGDAKLEFTWISPIYNKTSRVVQSGGGKKGVGASQERRWYGDICGAVCVCPDDAPVDALVYLFVNDEIAFTGPLTRSGAAHYANFTVPDFCQNARIYWGTKDSPLDDFILYPRATPPTSIGFNARDTSTYPWFDADGNEVPAGTPVPGIPNPQSGHYDVHPAYRNVCRIDFKNALLGASPNFPNVVGIFRRGTKFFAGRLEAEPGAGVNPMGPIYEILLDDLFGAGLPSSALIAANWQTTATELTAAETFIAPVLRNAGTLRAFVAEYLQYYDGWFRGIGDQLDAGHFSHGDLTTEEMPVLNSDHIQGEPNIQPAVLEETKNMFFVQFTNPQKWFASDDSERYIDDANRAMRNGLQVRENVVRPFIIDSSLAQRYATEYGRMHAAIGGGSGSVAVKREHAAAIRPGDRFKLDSAAFGLEIFLRCVSREWPGDRDGVAKLNVSVELADWLHLYIQPPVPKDDDFHIVPIDIAHTRIIEVPEELLPSPHQEVTHPFIAVLAARPSAASVGFRTYYSRDNSTYHLIGAKSPGLVTPWAVWAKIKTAAYAADTPPVDTTVGMVVELYGIDLESIVSQSDLERDAGHLLCFVGAEILSVGQIVALGSGRYRVYTLRGMFGTEQHAHPIDSDCWFMFRDHISPLTNDNFVPDGTVFFKLSAYTHGGFVPLAGITPIPFTFGRLIPFSVTGLELVGGASGHIFTGRDAHFAWRLRSIHPPGEIGSTDPLTGGQYDAEFVEFRIRVRDAVTGAEVFTDRTATPSFVFHYEQNAQANGGVHRSFFFGVAALDTDGLLSRYQEMLVDNPAPLALANLAVESGIDSIRIRFQIPSDLDYAGVIVHRSTTAGFTPSGSQQGLGTCVYRGNETEIVLPQQAGTTYYYRIGGFDAFGTDLLNFSAEIAIANNNLANYIQDLPMPSVAPGPMLFNGSVDVRLIAEGLPKYTVDGSEVLPSSPVFPLDIANWGPLTLTYTTVLHLRVFSGSHCSPQWSGVYVLNDPVGGGGGGTPRCGGVQIQRISGVFGHTTLVCRLYSVTAGATIFYGVDDDPVNTYTPGSNINLPLDSTLAAYASASGFSDSAISYYFNEARGGQLP